MKWFSVLVIFLVAVGIQAQTAIVPDARFLITDLGIELPVPSTWTYREADGVYFSASESDLDAATDNNPNTLPASPVMQLLAVQLQNPQAVTALPLRDSFDTVASQLGFQAPREPIPSSVLGRLSLTGFGTLNGGGMILTVWIQESQLVVMGLYTADEASALAQAQSWGTILSSIEAVDALPLDRKAESTYGFEMAYPSTWTSLNFESNGLFGVFETAADAQLVQSGTATTGIANASVVVSINRFAELNLTDDSETTDLQEILTTNLGLTDLLTFGEFFVNGQEGTGLYGKMPNGRWLYVVGVLDTQNDIVTFYMLAAATEVRLLELQPTFLTMLHSTNLDLRNLPE